MRGSGHEYADLAECWQEVIAKETRKRDKAPEFKRQLYGRLSLWPLAGFSCIIAREAPVTEVGTSPGGPLIIIIYAVLRSLSAARQRRG